MLRSVLVVAALGGTASANAQLTDAIAKHDEAAVSTLRSHLPDDSVRCTLGVVYLKRDDLSRADLYLAGCDEAVVDDAVKADVHAAIVETARKIRDSDLAGIDIVSAQASAEIDELPGETFAVPRQIWVPAGHHVVRVHANGTVYETPVDAKAHSRGPLVIDLPKPKKAAPPVDHTADFSDEAVTDAPTSGPPPDVKHPKMKVAILEKQVAATSSTDQLEDPLVVKRTSSTWRFGARAGVGAFTQNYGEAHAEPAVALQAGLELSRAADLTFRLDWARRGAETEDALGLTVGPTFTLTRNPSFLVRAGAGARLDVRLDGSDSGNAHAGGAGWVEIPLRSVPLTIALRFEQAATRQLDGTRDQATILELGWDLR